MKDFFDKLSSYNLFNYLLPGILFVVIADEVTTHSFVQKDILLGVFLYYFIGLVISRIGSLAVEPILKAVKFLRFNAYSEYVKASKEDPKVELLSEANNMYRTITGLFVCLLLLIIYDAIAMRWDWFSHHSKVIALFLLMILFLFAYRKQSEYISKRIDTWLKKGT